MHAIFMAVSLISKMKCFEKDAAFHHDVKYGLQTDWNEHFN